MRRPERRGVTERRFVELTRSLVGMRVSCAWRGYGSALFLELGALRPMPSPRQAKGQTGPRHSKGVATVMIEWSWRVERARSVEVGTWSSERRINAGIKRLTGSRISDITIDGRLPELVLALTGSRWSIRS